METKYRDALVQWQPHWDNPDFRGWALVAAYAMAAAFCARAALARRKTRERSDAAIWWLLACGLLFLAACRT